MPEQQQREQQTLPPQHQNRQPGLESEMHPQPEVFGNRYRPAGKLQGKAALITGGDGGLTAAAWVSGHSVLVMIYALGPISAAHFNPAVTLGFAVASRFPWRYVLPYWIAQVSGSILARYGFAPAHPLHIRPAHQLR